MKVSDQSHVQKVAAQLTIQFGLDTIIGQSRAIRAAVEKCAHYSQSKSTVHIYGETGTGKEVFARAIHHGGPRAAHPFIPVNCGALPENLIESLLFGHEAGAFTGAHRRQKGLIEVAEGGTLFLDEINSLPLLLQCKLLRFLQESEYRPLGSNLNHRADVRIITASNIDLPKAVESGHFREDLYYRINVLPLSLPALRERQEDIPLLANFLLRRRRAETCATANCFTEAGLKKLMTHHWPGNVRELENTIERALTLFPHVHVFDALHFDLPVNGPEPQEEPFQAQKARVIHEFEYGYVLRKLALYSWNIKKAAAAAHKERRTFFQLMRKLGLNNRCISELAPARRTIGGADASQE